MAELETMIAEQTKERDDAKARVEDEIVVLEEIIAKDQEID